MSTGLFRVWLRREPTEPTGLQVYREYRDARAEGLALLAALLVDHYVGEATVARAGGYTRAADVITNSLPTDKRIRSGDLGEIVATEYVESETSFLVPIKKLRWKSDRQVPMHGNDLIAIDSRSSPALVLKGECKSGERISVSTVSEAAATLNKHDGRPNPSTLAFITKRLYEAGRDDEAGLFQALQCDGAIAARAVVHSIFALAGNDPCQLLRDAPPPNDAEIIRQYVAILVHGHAELVAAVFSAYGAQP